MLEDEHYKYVRHYTSMNLTGFPGPGFHAIHASALVSILISMAASVTVLVFMFYKHRNKKFWKWLLGERIVVYLAIIDILWGVNHGTDHIVIYSTLKHPPYGLCVFFAFNLQMFMCAQSILVCCTACYGFLLIIKQYRLNLGCADYRLLLICFLPPVLLGVIFAATGILGPSGAWCFVDMRLKTGPIINTLYSAMVVVIFIINTFFYTSIWIKIKRSSDNMAKYNDRHMAMQTLVQRAKSMTLIVAAYIVQWLPFVIYSVWSYFILPPLGMLVVVVVVCNAGGVFNAIAYTYMKERYHRKIQPRIYSTFKGNTKEHQENNNGPQLHSTPEIITRL